ARAAAAAGDQVVPQVAGRASGLLFGLDTTYHPFQSRPTYAAMAALPPAEKLERLRDPEVRAAILAERDAPDRPSLLARIADAVDYEPPLEDSVGHIAARTGRTPAEVLYDMIVAGKPDDLFMIPVNNYADNTFEALREMLLHPNAVLGLSDGGAHCAIICDAS